MNRLLINVLFSVFLIGLAVFSASAQYEELGFQLYPQQLSKIKFAEKKLKKPISFEFSNTLEKYSLNQRSRGSEPNGNSKIGDFEGHELINLSHSNRKTAVVKIDKSLEGDGKKIRAVIDHYFLHFNLRLRPYPFFYVAQFHGCATNKQIPNRFVVWRLQDLLRHRIFKTELDKSDYYKLFDFEKWAVAKTKEHLSDLDFYASAVNYARASLEFKNNANLDKIRQIYLGGGKQKAIAKGEEIAKIIRQAKLSSSHQLDRTFKSVLNRLYSPKKPFRMRRDTAAKILQSRRDLFQISPICSTDKTNNFDIP